MGLVNLFVGIACGALYMTVCQRYSDDPWKVFIGGLLMAAVFMLLITLQLAKP